MLKRFLLLILTMAIAACAATSTESHAVRIDSSSYPAAEASYEAMMQGRSEAEKRKLALAVLMLNLEGVKGVYETLDNPELQSPSIGRIREKVSGMTAAEIIALASRVSDVRVEAPGR